MISKEEKTVDTNFSVLNTEEDYIDNDILMNDSLPKASLEFKKYMTRLFIKRGMSPEQALNMIKLMK
jgi:hypothetical protein